MPGAEAGAVGPSNVLTLRVSHHLVRTYALLAKFALPSPVAWRHLGWACHLIQDGATPPHSGALNPVNILQSAFKSGSHHQFEELLRWDWTAARADVRIGISEELSNPTVLHDEAKFGEVVEGLMLDLSEWSAARQRRLHEVLPGAMAGVGGMDEVLGLGRDCVRKAARYCTALCLLLGMHPS